jgi:hypothetical protein
LRKGCPRELLEEFPPVFPDRYEELPLLSKRDVADRIFDAALTIKATRPVKS